MTEKSFVLLEGNEIKIAFNKGAEIINQGDRSMIDHLERITRPVPLIE